MDDQDQISRGEREKKTVEVPPDAELMCEFLHGETQPENNENENETENTTPEEKEEKPPEEDAVIFFFFFS